MKIKKLVLKFVITALFFSLLAVQTSNVFAINILGATTPESFSKLVKKVGPAVVNINTSKTPKSNAPFSGVDPYFDKMFKSLLEKRGYVRPENRPFSLGTGFIISEDGHILTNYHVVAGADQISVTLNNERKVNAKVVGFDQKLDLAVLKLPAGQAYPTVELGNSDKAEIGDWAIAIGNPFGLGQTITVGIVSAKGRNLGMGPYDHFIQTDASINEGNSGGPLFNIDGKVIGINTVIHGNAQGIGFAIPINMAKSVANQLVKTGIVKRGWLGVEVKNFSEEEAKQADTKPGSIVIAVAPKSPASAAGLRPGDVITEINNDKVRKSSSLPRQIANFPPGTQISLKFYRKGKKFESEAVLGDLDNPYKSYIYPIQNGKKVGETNSSGSGIGFDLRNLEDGDKVDTTHGVMITKVHNKSLADSVGLKRDDVIIAVNNKKISTLKDFRKELNKVDKGSPLGLNVLRGNDIKYFAIVKSF